jgi:hypothetical protein
VNGSGIPGSRFVSGVRDRTGDATWPKFGSGKDIRPNDLTRVKLGSTSSGLTAILSVPRRVKASDLGASQDEDWGKAWMVQWWFDRALYFAKAEVGPNGLYCSEGTPVSVRNHALLGKSASYEFGTPTACRFDAKRSSIVIDVNPDGVGGPKHGKPSVRGHGVFVRVPSARDTDEPDGRDDAVHAVQLYE